MDKTEWTSSITYQLLAQGHDCGIISDQDAETAFNFYNTYLTKGCVASLKTASWLANQHWAPYKDGPSLDLGA